MKRKLSYLYASLFARSRLEKLHILLFQLSLRGLGIMNYQDSLISGERNLIQNVLPRLFQNNDPVVFDVGANIGNFSKEILNRFPVAKIFAFEPNPESYSSLHNISLPNFVALNYAVGKTHGEIDLFDLKDDHGSEHATIYEKVVTDIHHRYAKVHKVKILTLDEFALSQRISFIDLLKIDTEGSELSILQGAEHLLSKKQIGCVLFEFNEMNVISRSFMRDFRRLLYSFELFRILPTGFIKVPETPLLSEIFGFQNILAIPEENVRKIR